MKKTVHVFLLVLFLFSFYSCETSKIKIFVRENNRTFYLDQIVDKPEVFFSAQIEKEIRHNGMEYTICRNDDADLEYTGRYFHLTIKSKNILVFNTVSVGENISIIQKTKLKYTEDDVGNCTIWFYDIKGKENFIFPATEYREGEIVYYVRFNVKNETITTIEMGTTCFGE